MAVVEPSIYDLSRDAEIRTRNLFIRSEMLYPVELHPLFQPIILTEEERFELSCLLRGNGVADRFLTIRNTLPKLYSRKDLLLTF